MSWIKCVDKMPPVYTWVLVTIDIPYNDRPPSTHMAQWTGSGEWATLNEPWSLEQVSHWMPVTPPAEGWLGDTQAAEAHFRKHNRDL